MGDLYRKLREYALSDYYPYHMPGHKRQLCGETMAGLAQLDITEIDGFDNLHDAQGILRSIQEKAAEIYGAEESFYLINGSTAGILSAVSATVSEGEKILMSRGCHKAVYHSIFLRKLIPQYLNEAVDAEFGCSLPVTVEQVESALKHSPDVKAIIIVSPTYEGLVADVEGIARIAHKKGIPLIVDSAHGAHLGFHSAWPENSCRLGADLVIESLHKSLPAPTQTAVLHLNGSLVDKRKLKKYLQIYQTSSPSYLLMAAMEDALDIVAEKGDELFSVFLENWREMLAKLNTCKHIRVLQREGSDIGKLVVMDCSGSFSGGQLYEMLLNRYHLQMEMATERYVLAMFTIGDKPEAYKRLTAALMEIDKEAETIVLENAEHTANRISVNCPFITIKNEDMQTIYPKVVLMLAEAWEKETEEVLLCLAKGRVSGAFINLYPPGIPLVVPGEELSEEMCNRLQFLADSGLNVQGLQMREEGIKIKVVK